MNNIKQKRKPHTHLKCSTGLGILLSLWATPTLAADQVVLTFNDVQVNIPVTELATFAQTGQMSGNLTAYAQLAPKDYLTDFRRLLQENFQLSPTTISQFSKGQTGQIVFQALGQFLRTPDNQNGQTALVTAFTSAAANPKGFTIVDVIRAFPGSSIQIDGQLSFKAVTAINQSLRDRGLIVKKIQQLATASPATPVSSLPNLTQPGPSQWSKQTLNLDARTLGFTEPVAVDYYLPQGLTTPAPVVVIAYGFASNRSTFAYVAEHLASYGFVVVVPSFAGTNTRWVSEFLGAKGPADVNIATSLLRRPRTITLLLDDLQQKVQSNPAFKQVNPQQVGILGQSLGGYTALASAGAPINFPEIQQQCSNVEQFIFSFNLSLVFECQLYGTPKITNSLPIRNGNLADPRVKAVIAINPLASAIFGQQGMSQIKVPTMLISGSDDIVTPSVPEQIYPFTWLTTPNKYLFLLQGGTHFSFLDDDAQSGLPVPPDLIGPDPKLAHPSLKAVSTAFFRSYLLNQQQSLSYLNQSYVQTLVPQPFSVSLIKSLTSNQLQQVLAAPTTP
jgi:predicted dienelactone hydrolase